jgi:uncharacterized protein YlxW (UPF0749 family)
MSGFVARARSLPSWQVTLGVALLVLGFLVVAQVRAEKPRVRYTSQERPPLLQTALELQKRQETLKDRILELRTSIRDIEANAAGNDVLVAAVNADLEQARLAAGLVELVGPGIVLQLEDSNQPVPPDAAPGDYRVTASDLRDVTNEVWLAGAEAIGINGERVTATSALTDIGSSVLLNSAYLQPPYQITVIGPPDLYARLTTSVNFVAFVRDRVQGFGIRFGVAQLDQVVVPAYAGAVNLGYALPVPSATPRAPSSAGPSARPSASPPGGVQ